MIIRTEADILGSLDQQCTKLLQISNPSYIYPMSVQDKLVLQYMANVDILIVLNGGKYMANMNQYSTNISILYPAEVQPYNNVGSIEIVQ